MNTLFSFKSFIIKFLSNQDILKKYYISEEFPYKIKSNPLNNPNIIVSFSKISLDNTSKSFLGNSNETLKENYGKIVDIDLAFDIYVSISSKSSILLEVFDNLTEILISNKYFHISSISSEDINFNKSLSCFHLRVICNTSIILSEEISSDNISDFNVRIDKI